jgi:hypothetical protein
MFTDERNRHDHPTQHRPRPRRLGRRPRAGGAVIERLQADGYRVTAPQFPLTSLADDVARLRQVLNVQSGRRSSPATPMVARS